MVIFRKPISGVTELSLSRFVGQARRAVGLTGGVTVLVTNNDEIRELNSRFRRKDKPTDVLSFPAVDIAGEANGGDIAISVNIAGENAAKLGHPLATELKVLALHGILHLAGYDHEVDNGKMARKEARLRRELRLPDALIERTNGTPAKKAATRKASIPARASRKVRTETPSRRRS